MYDYLVGTIAERQGTRLVLEVGGVGYDLAVPLGANFEGSEGAARVWTHFAVREDSQQLYGFSDRPTRDLFRLLLGVRGVGPSMALALLSDLGVDELVQAVLSEQVSALVKVKGVGKKTAQQLLLDLKDSPALRSAGSSASPESASAQPALVEDAVSALLSIGFTEREARRNIDAALRELKTEDLEALVRAAISR
ncbi:MAG: Holliday junction branch migration protein RuvA [Planctomycetes bacterium]|nr:Holliday junction branch migration protein RuvA [Planctomycetota bacterium]